MFGRFVIVGSMIASLATAAPVRRNDMGTPYHDAHQGMVRKLSEIEAGIIPNMRKRGCTYIGAEYDARALRYRLKFMNDGKVIWIDVDGRNGQIIGQAGM